MDKLKHGIESIAVNDATMQNITIKDLTLINFFFGNNGTGKSTIAKAIKQKKGLTWSEDVSSDKCEILVFDRDYVDEEFRSFENLKGVFTVGKINADAQEEITTKAKEKQECDKAAAEANAIAQRKKTELDKLLDNFRNDCWEKGSELREILNYAMDGYKGTKAKFATEILSGTNPVEYDLNELQSLCETAFSSTGRQYPRFDKVGEFIQLLNMKEAYALLDKPITSSSDSDFAKFLRALEAADWVSQGHIHYASTANGKCPYCQQTLPPNFEETIAACFDEQYQDDIDSLNELLEAYTSDMNGFIRVLEANLQKDLFPKINLDEYKSRLELLKRTIDGNIRKIKDKIKEPSSIIKLDDVKTIRNEINDIIDSFNTLIDGNNAIITSKTEKKAECKKKTKEHLAYFFATDIKKYNNAKLALEKEYNEQLKIYNEKHSHSLELDRDIVALNKSGIGTRATIDAVNKTLRDAGMQGFRLYPKDGKENVYEVRRDNSKVPAKNLSEGERNFIAFLYFYHVVRGSYDETGKKKSKIVVIDDPVSSMDSGVLFLVSTLIQELIEICNNNVNIVDRTFKGDDIEQIFILTHNTYFHREVTYNQVSRYEFVSFFLIQKTNNKSTVRSCIREIHEGMAIKKENYNPVQNSYKALWSEFKDLTNLPTTLTITTLSVIRRILEYYFLQLCGYDGVNLRKEVLEKNKDSFIISSGDDSPDDDSKFHLAQSMLSYIGKQDHGFNDGIDFVDESTDTEQCKEVFRMIFNCMNQIQHYNMMMEIEDKTN